MTPTPAKPWKMVGTTAAAAALGLGATWGLASGPANGAPKRIELRDTRTAPADEGDRLPVSAPAEVRLGGDTGSLDSPLTDRTGTEGTVLASPASAASGASPAGAASPGSPNSPAGAASPASPTSVASPAPAPQQQAPSANPAPTPPPRPAPTASPASPASAASPASTQSPDN